MICFTDNPNAVSTVWKIRPIPEELASLSKVKQQRIVKICPHRYLPEYDISIWVDGNIKVKGDLNNLLSEYDLTKTHLYTRIHPSRRCVYEEAKAILGFGKDRPENINPIISRYEQEGYPRNIGMAETCVIIRAHNERDCRLFDEAWATELMLNSHRDQMSFNYVAWKRHFQIGYMANQYKVNGSDYFVMMRHG